MDLSNLTYPTFAPPPQTCNAQPSAYPLATALQMANGSVWEWDQLPARNQKLHQMLNSDYDRPAAMFIHCSAGCDRTGEVVGRCVSCCILQGGCLSSLSSLWCLQPRATTFAAGMQVSGRFFV